MGLRACLLFRVSHCRCCFPFASCFILSILIAIRNTRPAQPLSSSNSQPPSTANPPYIAPSAAALMSRLVLSEPHLGTLTLTHPRQYHPLCPPPLFSSSAALFAPGPKGHEFYPDVIASAARLLVPGARSCSREHHTGIVSDTQSVQEGLALLKSAAIKLPLCKTPCGQKASKRSRPAPRDSLLLSCHHLIATLRIWRFARCMRLEQQVCRLLSLPRRDSCCAGTASCPASSCDVQLLQYLKL